MNSTDSEFEAFPLLRQPTSLLIVYCLAYGVVFVLGLSGNTFIVVSVCKYRSLRNVTNYLITSLALADLLVMTLCLPSTLLNNLLTEFLLGNFICKVSQWISGTTVCASVYTLVAVSADRFFAIVHPLRYSLWMPHWTFYVIILIWTFSSVMFVPWLVYFQEYHYQYSDEEVNISIRLCLPFFPSIEVERMYFLICNFLLAFLVPLIGITISYAYIFARLNKPTVASDLKASQRQQRARLQVTRMMVAVVVLFGASWLPLYVLFTYLYFYEPNPDEISQTVLRPIFQWLSLASSSGNPIIYCYYSRHFRRAVQQLFVGPCRGRYRRFKHFTMIRLRRQRSRSPLSVSTSNAATEWRNGGGRIEKSQAMDSPLHFILPNGNCGTHLNQPSSLL